MNVNIEIVFSIFSKTTFWTYVIWQKLPPVTTSLTTQR